MKIKILFFSLVVILLSSTINAQTQGSDLQRAKRELDYCMSKCNEEFKKNAYSKPAVANRIEESCRGGCLDRYSKKNACITTQMHSNYSSARCDDFNTGSRNNNPNNSSSGVLSGGDLFSPLVASFLILFVAFVLGFKYRIPRILFEQAWSEKSSKNKVINAFILLVFWLFIYLSWSNIVELIIATSVLALFVIINIFLIFLLRKDLLKQVKYKKIIKTISLSLPFGMGFLMAAIIMLFLKDAIWDDAPTFILLTIIGLIFIYFSSCCLRVNLFLLDQRVDYIDKIFILLVVLFVNLLDWDWMAFAFFMGCIFVIYLLGGNKKFIDFLENGRIYKVLLNTHTYVLRVCGCNIQEKS